MTELEQAKDAQAQAWRHFDATGQQDQRRYWQYLQAMCRVKLLELDATAPSHTP